VKAYAGMPAWAQGTASSGVRLLGETWIWTEEKMGHTYAISEIVGTSEKSIDDAIKSGIATASKSLRHLDWFEVSNVRGHLADGKVGHYQVTLRVGFRYEVSGS
jgi:flavin-binding protein dodecin